MRPACRGGKEAGRSLLAKHPQGASRAAPCATKKGPQKGPSLETPSAARLSGGRLGDGRAHDHVRDHAYDGPACRGRDHAHDAPQSRCRVRSHLQATPGPPKPERPGRTRPEQKWRAVISSWTFPSCCRLRDLRRPVWDAVPGCAATALEAFGFESGRYRLARVDQWPRLSPWPPP